MGMDTSRFPDPYRSRTDISHASVFLVALLLLVAVAAMLFYGSSWVFAPASLLSGRGAAATSQVGANRTPVGPLPTFGAPTAVPPLAGVVIQPTPAPTTPPPPSTATPPPAVTPTPTPPPPTPTPPGGTPVKLGYVGNTGGDGVYLRRTPRLNDRTQAWADFTALVLLGAEADGDGQHWLQVRDPKNNVGWVPAQFVQR
jgi:hypothetical protein